MCYNIVGDNMRLGIIGGVGSMASAYFYEMIIENTKVNCDQEHIDMVILNHATIPDRTAYILGKSNKSPLPELLKDIKFFLENKGYL